MHFDYNKHPYDHDDENIWFGQLNACNGHILSLYLLMNSKGISYSFTFIFYISKHEINPGLEIIVKLNSMFMSKR